MLIITRHPALIQYLQEIELVDKDDKVLTHVSESDVEGQHVIGVLPFNLAAHAASVTEGRSL